MTTTNKDMVPPLPRPYVPSDSENPHDYYTADQMHEYAAISLLASATSAPAPYHNQAELQRGFDRYEKLRKLKPRQFDELHKRNLDGEFFDDLVDALPGTAPQPAGDK